MEHEDPLIDLFRQAAPPAPPPDFVSRTMRAVRREPLPVGRRRLRNPLVIGFGWTAVTAGVALSALMILIDQPIFAATFTAILSDGLTTGIWLVQFARTGITLLDVFSTTGSAVSRAMLTREGSMGLLLMSVMGVLSLSALRRLLMFEGPERGVSQWPEL